MKIQEKFETVRNIMKNHKDAKFDGTTELIKSKSKQTLYEIRNEIIRAGIDEVYDVNYYEGFQVYILSLHLTKGRSW